MRINELSRRMTLKSFLILASVTILYTLYRYEGSAGFYQRCLSRIEGALASQEAAIHYQRAMALLLLGVAPMLIVRFGFRERLKDYGLGLEKPALALLLAILGVVFMTPFTYFGGRSPDLGAFYPQMRNAGASPLLFLRSSISYLVYYVGYEFCFRGFLFMGTSEDVGDWQALGVSLAASVLLHVTQPQSEMFMAILAGMVFPLLAKKFNSIWPGVIIHAYTGISLDYWVIFHRGVF